MRNVFIVFISPLILKLALIAVDDVEDVPLLAIAFAENGVKMAWHIHTLAHHAIFTSSLTSVSSI